jgi:hypothetical protein
MGEGGFSSPAILKIKAQAFAFVVKPPEHMGKILNNTN